MVGRCNYVMGTAQKAGAARRTVRTCTKARTEVAEPPQVDLQVDPPHLASGVLIISLRPTMMLNVSIETVMRKDSSESMRVRRTLISGRPAMSSHAWPRSIFPIKL